MSRMVSTKETSLKVPALDYRLLKKYGLPWTIYNYPSVTISPYNRTPLSFHIWLARTNIYILNSSEIKNSSL